MDAWGNVALIQLIILRTCNAYKNHGLEVDVENVCAPPLSSNAKKKKSFLGLFCGTFGSYFFYRDIAALLYEVMLVNMNVVMKYLSGVGRTKLLVNRPSLALSPGPGQNDPSIHQVSGS